jgi:starch phosphorylase
MRESMCRLTPRFSADRTVREYTEDRYLPAAAAYRERSADKGKFGVQVVAWQQALQQEWSTMRFGEAKVQTRGGQHDFEVELYLHDLDPGAVRVELYADGSTPFVQEMKRGRPLPGTSRGYVYSAAVSAVLPPADYTARVIPSLGGVAVPLEEAHILWQR